MTQTIKKPNKSKKPRKSLSKAELGLISQLLLLAEEEIAYSGSEEVEYSILATEENKEMMKQFIMAEYDKRGREMLLTELEEEKDELVYGIQLVDYLSRRCSNLSKS